MKDAAEGKRFKGGVAPVEGVVCGGFGRRESQEGGKECERRWTISTTNATGVPSEVRDLETAAVRCWDPEKDTATLERRIRTFRDAGNRQTERKREEGRKE